MTIDKVLETLDELAQIAQFFPPASASAVLAEKLIQAVEKINAAHQALYGKPLDYSLLKPYTPVPLPETPPVQPPG